jgi:hypothetical protein
MGKILMNKLGLALPLLMIMLVLVTGIPGESSAATATFGLNNGNATWNQSSNILDAMRFQNNAGSGTLTKLEILFNDTTPNGKVRMGVFTDNNRKPGSLLLDAGEVNVANGWVSLNSLNLQVIQSTYYWLAFVLKNQNGVRYQSGQSAGSHYWVSYRYGLLPGQFSLVGASYNSSPYVMRATVTTGGSTPQATITVNDFTNYRVFQRDIGRTSKSVTISGTYSNMDWNHVDARILQHDTNTAVVDWTTIDTTPGGGTFSGNILVPQGGWYNVETRALDNAGSVIGSSRGKNKWGVGMIILCIGQSNMSGHGQPPFTTVTSDLAVNYSNAGIWEHLADPYDDGSPAGAVDNDNATAGGSMVPALANSLLQTFNFPIAFVPSPKDGTNLYSQWAYRNSSNHYDTTTLYGQSITKAQSVGGVELIIMHQGEADTNAHRTEAQYEADFATLIGHYHQDLYAKIPIFFCQLGTIELGTNTRTEADVLAVRDAQHDLDNGVNIFMAATAMDQPRLDAVHYTCKGLNAIGERIAQTIKYYFGATSYYRGPTITFAYFADANRNSVYVQIDHLGGNDITPASGITGFSLLSDGSPVGIIAAEHSDVDQIRLTLASAIPESSTAKLRYLRNSNPNTSALVKDNSSLALPLENTTTDITVH